MRTVRIRGAREHNLKAVDLDLPWDSFVVFTGVSGSGKSSLALDTVHAEARHRYLEALGVRFRGRNERPQRPAVDVITGLPPTVALTQSTALPGGATVITYADLAHGFRVMFARAGVQHCPGCGDGIVTTPHDVIVDRIMEMPDGARVTLEAPVTTGDDAIGVLEEIGRSGFSRVRLAGVIRRIEDVSEPVHGELRIVVDRIRVRPDRRARLDDAVRTTGRAGGGAVVVVAEDGETAFIDRPYCLRCQRALPAMEPGWFSRSGSQPCAACKGTGRAGSKGAAAQDCAACEGCGLSEDALAVQWNGVSWPTVLSWPASEAVASLLAWSDRPHSGALDPLAEDLVHRFALLTRMGVEHLRLGRRCATLSSGELQRLRMARHVSSRVSGVLFVLDEPSTGLEADRVADVVEWIRELRALGNGVWVVEHHPDVIRAAEWVVEFGPGAGVAGGEILFSGVPADLPADTPTGQFLAGTLPIVRRTTAGAGAWVCGVGDRQVSVAMRGLTVVAGPSGSGKSLLLAELVRKAPDTFRVIDTNALAGRGSRRSNPATFTGLWDTMRTLLAATREAQIRALSASSFSLNVKGGRCERCAGVGDRKVALELLPDARVPCDVCHGRRFNRDVLEVRWRGLSADQLLDLTAAEAHPILAGHPRLELVLRALRDVGLGYVPLGQPMDTLSGGEGRRLRLARELGRSRRGAEKTLVVLDDPTAGLHQSDVVSMVRLFDQLIEDGATVVVATHNPELRGAADRVIQL